MTLSSKPRSARRSISKHGRRACSNTTSANHISPHLCHPVTFARSCRTRNPCHGEDLLTSGTRSLRRGEALPMSGTIMDQHHHDQPTLSAHRAASANTASQTVSQARTVKCLFPCDLRHRHRTVRTRDLNRGGRRLMVGFRLRPGECTAMCSRLSCCAILSLHNLFFCTCLSSAGHFWSYSRMCGMSHFEFNIWRNELAEADIATSSSIATHSASQYHIFFLLPHITSNCRSIAYLRQSHDG